MLTNDVYQQLLKIVGDKKITRDSAELSYWGKDSTQFSANASAIIFPQNIEQLQAIVQLANREGIALVPSAGRTGLSGGAVAIQGEVVVSLRDMNAIKQFNAIDRTVVCEAGVITADLQAFAEQQGLYYPVDFASSGSSLIGGNISTNAGGIKVLKYGMTRQWVAGLKVITGAGDILDMNKSLLKNNTGYDIQQLFIGAEGTLGFVAEATMRLTRPPEHLTVLLLAVPHLTALLQVLAHFQVGMELTAFEFFSEQALQKVTAQLGLQRPCNEVGAYYTLVEFEAKDDMVIERAMSLFEQCLEQGIALDGVISQNQSQYQNLWRLREEISSVLAQWQPLKHDLSVPPSQQGEFLLEVEKILSELAPQYQVIWYGHIGDGNVHLNILKPDELTKAEFDHSCKAISVAIFERLATYKGSVSAEHGIGLLKKDYLHYSRSALEIALMKGIKQQLDPKGLMNPGKIF
ncbi:FAD-binding oxidoreductase [Dasania marina]|uniref:FAD-binding oxidoreductase n=1 Tax=Dasania marina TaxID=471499 RepID=UPI0030D8EEB0|tara:strand:- start:42039 stop:43424 length:1386 start_codon:yes stop_codon:yes gene_type:complete